MDNYSAVLRDCNIKVTPQRLSVFKALNDAYGHLSVDDVYQRVKVDMPAISLATVYSVLEHLREHGLVNEIKIDFERSLYESHKEEHHHFLCRTCKKVIDITMPLCMALKNKKIEGHIIEDFQGYFYGTCNSCKPRK